MRKTASLTVNAFNFFILLLIFSTLHSSIVLFQYHGYKVDHARVSRKRKKNLLPGLWHILEKTYTTLFSFSFFSQQVALFCVIKNTHAHEKNIVTWQCVFISSAIKQDYRRNFHCWCEHIGTHPDQFLLMFDFTWRYKIYHKKKKNSWEFLASCLRTKPSETDI